MDQILGTVGNTLNSYWSYAQTAATRYASSGTHGSTKPLPTRRRTTFREIRCPSCSEVLTNEHDPRTLQCEHSFCLECLKRAEYSQVIKCPECQDTTILEDSGVDGLERYSLPVVDDFESPRGTASYLSKSFVDVDLNKSGQVERTPGEEDPEVEEGEEVEQDEDDFVVLSAKSVNIVPSYYVPFTQTKELCPTLVNHWLSSIWFPPSDLNESKVLQEFRPVHVPFYSFHVQTETSYDVELGKTKENGEVEWEEVSGKVFGNYEELMTVASYSVDRPLVMALLSKQGSFSLNTEKKLPANPPIYTAETELKEQVLPVDFGQEEAFELAGKRKVFKGDERACKDQIKQTYNPEQKRNFSCKTKITKLDFFVILLPVFASAFTYQNTSYELVISGNKGVVEGRRPYGSGLLGKMVADSWKTLKNVYRDTV